jgi:hypothetical protein
MTFATSGSVPFSRRAMLLATAAAATTAPVVWGQDAARIYPLGFVVQPTLRRVSPELRPGDRCAEGGAACLISK